MIHDPVSAPSGPLKRCLGAAFPVICDLRGDLGGEALRRLQSTL